jgi:hypothetical protein
MNLAQDPGEVESLDSPEQLRMRPLRQLEKARKPLKTRAETGDHRTVGHKQESSLIVEEGTGARSLCYLFVYLSENTFDLLEALRSVGVAEAWRSRRGQDRPCRRGRGRAPAGTSAGGCKDPPRLPPIAAPERLGEPDGTRIFWLMTGYRG